MIAVEAKNLSLSFGKRKVLEDLSLKIEAGDFVCLLGASGCGKSTLLRLLSGLLKPDRGEIQKDKGSTSFVFQDARLLPWKTVEENILLPFKLLKKPLPSAEIVLKQVGLWEARKLYPHQLSGGMKQRASIARALITEPDLLLMDEPFSALDEATRHELEILLRELWERRRMTLVFVTHSVSEAVFLGERLLAMSARDRGWLVDRRLSFPVRDEAFRTSPQMNDEVRTLSQNLKHALRESEEVQE